MIVVPFFIAIAFLGPPATVARVHHGRIVHAVRSAQVQPIVAMRALRPWWQAGARPPVSRAASRIS